MKMQHNIAISNWIAKEGTYIPVEYSQPVHKMMNKFKHSTT